MSKIKSLHINNFKFFGETAPIVLNGKNLLLYGENGSGKSSVSNAIYTLLEAASKTPEGVQRYFLPMSEEHADSLVNIHAKVDENGLANSFISIEDTNGKEYRLSYSDTTLCGDLSLLESQRSSDFINYKALFSFQAFTHSKDLNLAQVFDYAVIPYLSCPLHRYQGKEIKTLSDMFNAYRDVPSLRQDNGSGRMVIYKYRSLYRHYQALEERLNEYMEELVLYIDSQLSTILSALEYNFKAKLTYNKLTHTKHETWIEFHDYSIMLTITEYDGVPVTIRHPHSFLNEAKMAALAFAIRWAVLTQYPDAKKTPNALHVLVLDDLMISLDMGNRENMLKFLLNNSKASEYQILFLTHERQLFDMMLLKLQQKYDRLQDISIEDEWCMLEMYEHDEGDKHFPLVQPYMSAYLRALAYFKGENGWRIDYSASGNALRQAIEEEFKRIFHMIRAVNEDGTNINYNKLMIGDCVNIALFNFPKHSFSIDVVDATQTLTKYSLNPLSHNNTSMEYYKGELQKAFVACRVLQAIKMVKLIPAESVLSFNVECEDGTVNHYCVQVLEDIYAIIDSANRCGEILDKVDVLVWMEGIDKKYPREKETLLEIYSSTIAHLKKSISKPIDKSDNLWDEYSLNHKTIRTLFDANAVRICRELHITQDEKEEEKA